MSRPRRQARPRTASGQPAAPWSWALVGLVLGALLTLAVLAPARWLTWAVARASQDQVQLVQAEGRVWDGSARLLLTGGQGSQDRIALPGRLHWQLRPDWRGLQLRLGADCCTPQGPLQLQLRARWGGLQLQLADSRSHWPASLLVGLGTPFNTLQPEGELELDTRGLAMQWLSGRLQLQGTAQLNARQLSSRVSSLRPMGSYQLDLVGGDIITVQLSTLEGGLLLSGNGQWVGQRLRFQGEARAAEGLQDQLANLLNVLGQRQGDRALMVFN